MAYLSLADLGRGVRDDVARRHGVVTRHGEGGGAGEEGEKNEALELVESFETISFLRPNRLTFIVSMVDMVRRNPSARGFIPASRRVLQDGDRDLYFSTRLICAELLKKSLHLKDSATIKVYYYVYIFLSTRYYSCQLCWSSAHNAIAA